MFISHAFCLDLPFLTNAFALFTANTYLHSKSNHDLDKLVFFKLLTIAQFVKTPFINLIEYEISDYH